LLKTAASVAPSDSVRLNILADANLPDQKAHFDSLLKGKGVQLLHAKRQCLSRKGIKLGVYNLDVRYKKKFDNSIQTLFADTIVSLKDQGWISIPQLQQSLLNVDQSASGAAQRVAAQESAALRSSASALQLGVLDSPTHFASSFEYNSPCSFAWNKSGLSIFLDHPTLGSEVELWIPFAIVDRMIICQMDISTDVNSLIIPLLQAPICRIEGEDDAGESEEIRFTLPDWPFAQSPFLRLILDDQSAKLAVLIEPDGLRQTIPSTFHLYFAQIKCQNQHAVMLDFHSNQPYWWNHSILALRTGQPANLLLSRLPFSQQELRRLLPGDEAQVLPVLACFARLAEGIPFEQFIELTVRTLFFLPLVFSPELNKSFSCGQDLLKIAQKRIQSLLDFPSDRSSASKGSLDRVCMVSLSPSAVRCSLPTWILSNRVLRHFGAENFILVSFVDEGGSRVPINSGADSISNWVTDKLANGFRFCGEDFAYVASSNSQAREGHGWFVKRSPKLPHPRVVRSWIGELEKITPISKFVARMGLAFTSTRPSIDLNEFSVIPDIQRNGHLFTDGAGQISVDLAEEVTKSLGLPMCPTAFQIRFQGCKGVLSVSPNHKQNSVAFRESMRKFDCNTHKGLDIVAFSQPQPCYLNQQIIMLLESLGVPIDVFDKLMQRQIAEIPKLFTDGAPILKQVRPFFFFPKLCSTFIEV